MNQHDVGLFIASKRREKNLTQEQLAEKIGVSNKTVSKWETGKTMPDYSVVELLCQVLNISVSELIAGKEKEPDANKSSYEEDMALLSYKIEQLENHKKSQIEASKTVKTGMRQEYILCHIKNRLAQFILFLILLPSAVEIYGKRKRKF